MEFGICLQSVIPVRAEPSHRAEMVTQVLFGELYRIISHDKDWVRIQLSYDDYQGWITVSQNQELSETEFVDLNIKEAAVTIDLVQLVTNDSNQTILPVILGSSLPGYNSGKFLIHGDTYAFEGQVSGGSVQAAVSGKKIIGDALLYLNAPYFWGGRTPFGVDCSGFVQMVYKLSKIKLLRDTWQQATQGESVNLISEALPGDIAFFDDIEGNIIHTGIITDKTHIIHASGRVRIDAIDHEGIFNAEIQRYTHRLRAIKRIL
jgi:gamma-D-glutamyl-L-lysine dipeptidyl-peptidase